MVGQLSMYDADDEGIEVCKMLLEKYGLEFIAQTFNLTIVDILMILNDTGYIDLEYFNEE